MNRKFGLTMALLLPIIVLTGNAWMHHQHRTASTTITLPIEGFDPRDLLSGHYLIYRIDYGIRENSNCPASDITASLCLTPERRIYPVDELPENCTQFISGNCDNNTEFVSGLEHFYIPEQYAEILDEKVRNKQGKLVISVDQSGNAGVIDLLIDDQPWKEFVSE